MVTKVRAPGTPDCGIAGSTAPTALGNVRAPSVQANGFVMVRRALISVAADSTLTRLATSCALQLLRTFPARAQFAKPLSTTAALEKPWLHDAQALMQTLVVWEQGTASTQKTLRTALPRCEDMARFAEAQLSALAAASDTTEYQT